MARLANPSGQVHPSTSGPGRDPAGVGAAVDRPDRVAAPLAEVATASTVRRPALAPDRPGCARRAAGCAAAGRPGPLRRQAAARRVHAGRAGAGWAHAAAQPASAPRRLEQTRQVRVTAVAAHRSAAARHPGGRAAVHVVPPRRPAAAWPVHDRRPAADRPAGPAVRAAVRPVPPHHGLRPPLEVRRPAVDTACTGPARSGAPARPSAAGPPGPVPHRPTGAAHYHRTAVHPADAPARAPPRTPAPRQAGRAAVVRHRTGRGPAGDPGAHPRPCPAGPAQAGQVHRTAVAAAGRAHPARVHTDRRPAGPPCLGPGPSWADLHRPAAAGGHGRARLPAADRPRPPPTAAAPRRPVRPAAVARRRTRGARVRPRRHFAAAPGRPAGPPRPVHPDTAGHAHPAAAADQPPAATSQAAPRQIRRARLALHPASRARPPRPRGQVDPTAVRLPSAAYALR